MPFAGGKVDPSEAGKKGAEARWGNSDSGGVIAEGPVDVLAEMEAIFSRKRGDDRTDFQKKLREWYERDFEGYMDRLVRLRGKGSAQPRNSPYGKSDAASSSSAQPCPVCEARTAEEAFEQTDEGTERARALCHELLSQCAVQAHIGSAIGDRWVVLSDQQRRLILDTAGVPYTFKNHPNGTEFSVLTRYGMRDDRT